MPSTAAPDPLERTEPATGRRPEITPRWQRRPQSPAGSMPGSMPCAAATVSTTAPRAADEDDAPPPPPPPPPASDDDEPANGRSSGSGTATAAPAKKTKPKTAPPQRKRLPPWRVLLHNDDVNEMGYVVQTITMLTPLGREVAIRCMLEAHLQGVAQLLVTHKERAELYQEQFQSKQLVVSIEPTEGDGEG